MQVFSLTTVFCIDNTVLPLMKMNQSLHVVKVVLRIPFYLSFISMNVCHRHLALVEWPLLCEACQEGFFFFFSLSSAKAA